MVCTVVKPATAPLITVSPTKANNTRRRNFASAFTLTELINFPQC